MDWISVETIKRLEATVRLDTAKIRRLNWINRIYYYVLRIFYFLYIHWHRVMLLFGIICGIMIANICASTLLILFKILGLLLVVILLGVNFCINEKMSLFADVREMWHLWWEAMGSTFFKGLLYGYLIGSYTYLINPF